MYGKASVLTLLELQTIMQRHGMSFFLIVCTHYDFPEVQELPNCLKMPEKSQITRF